MDNEEEKSEETLALEEEFKALIKKIQPEIEKELEDASAALLRACDLSEKYGIPFWSRVSFLGQSYFPTNTPNLDQEFVMEETGTYTEYFGEGAGWEHSAVC